MTNNEPLARQDAEAVCSTCKGTKTVRVKCGNNVYGERCDDCNGTGQRPSPSASEAAQCGYRSHRAHTCQLPAGHQGDHNSRADGTGSFWGTDDDDELPQAERPSASEASFNAV